MANNRMYLVDKDTGEKVLLAKYYPSSGWYIKRPVTLIDAFFDKCRDESIELNNDAFGLGGSTNFSLEFEHNGKKNSN